MKPGLEILKAPDSTAGEIARILGNGHPPFAAGSAVPCDYVTCEACWLAWLTTGKPPAATAEPVRPQCKKKTRL